MSAPGQLGLIFMSPKCFKTLSAHLTHIIVFILYIDTVPLSIKYADIFRASPPSNMNHPDQSKFEPKLQARQLFILFFFFFKRAKQNYASVLHNDIQKSPIEGESLNNAN